MLKTMQDGYLLHCEKPVVWKDCPNHEECYYFECQVCNHESETDCQEGK